MISIILFIKYETVDHILQCGGTGCTDEDLAFVHETAIAAIGRWKNLISFNLIFNKELYIPVTILI